MKIYLKINYQLFTCVFWECGNCPDDITFEGDSEQLSCWVREEALDKVKTKMYGRQKTERHGSWVQYLAGFSVDRDAPSFMLATTVLVNKTSFRAKYKTASNSTSILHCSTNRLTDLPQTYSGWANVAYRQIAILFGDTSSYHFRY